jgi:hypothetical protein
MDIPADPLLAALTDTFHKAVHPYFAITQQG